MELDNDIDKLLKSFNKLDNYVAKYIYNKYIKGGEVVEGVEGEEVVEGVEGVEGGEGVNNKDNKCETLMQFMTNIFSIDRPNIITQKESLETELENMEIADEEYDKDPLKFKTRQFNSLPDIKRCSFIRKHKNKYKRCANGIINNDADMCYKHIKSKNMYWDGYCKALEKYIKP